MPRLYEGKDLRCSHVVWQEHKSPYVVVEFLSPGTEADDLGRCYDESGKVPSADPLPPVSDAASSGAEQSIPQPPGKFKVYEQYFRVPSHWLRWCDQAGSWFLTDTE